MPDMARPYHIGKRKVSQDEFDAEVLRLTKIGCSDSEVATRIGGVDRTTIWRAMKRLKERDVLKVREAKQEQKFQLMKRDKFLSLPEVQSWITNMQARQIKGWRTYAGELHNICDKLQALPAMLDLTYAEKFLAMESTVKTPKQMRESKTTFRTYLKFSRGYSDSQMNAIGLDAKHHGDGEYATVQLTEEQIKQADEILSSGYDTKTFLAFRLGIECCCPVQELLRMKRSDYNKVDGYLRTYREKTQSFWTKYPSEYTAKLILASPTEQLFTEADLDQVRTSLRQIYEKVGAQNKYFHFHPLHALRHTGAQRLLRRTNWNRAIVAVLGGWEAEKTLEDHYGAVPDDIIHSVGKTLW